MAAEGQEHPISVYLKIWILLFVLSIGSYMVDFFQLQGWLRWSLILLFMFLKAGFIMAIFMHMVWERMALVAALLTPMIAILVFISIMGYESSYTQVSRDTFFDDGKPDKVWAIPHGAHQSDDHEEQHESETH
jgi:cytochrome c oxidase subunit IV